MSAHVDREAEYPGTEVRHSYGYAAQIHILGLFGAALLILFVFFFQAEDGIRDVAVTGVQTCALPILKTSTFDGSEAGLLGIAVDPGFETNQFVYVYYTSPGPILRNRVSRFTTAGEDRKSVV